MKLILKPAFSEQLLKDKGAVLANGKERVFTAFYDDIVVSFALKFALYLLLPSTARILLPLGRPEWQLTTCAKINLFRMLKQNFHVKKNRHI